MILELSQKRYLPKGIKVDLDQSVKDNVTNSTIKVKNCAQTCPNYHFKYFVNVLVACDKPQTQEHANLVIDKTLCQFSVGECYKKVADLQVGLLIDPINTPSEKPLIVTLSSNQKITNISMRIEGRDMFMGIIPVSLSEIKDNVYQGPVIFGSCSSNYMVWRVFVSFDYQQQPRTLMYDFLADNDNN